MLIKIFNSIQFYLNSHFQHYSSEGRNDNISLDVFFVIKISSLREISLQSMLHNKTISKTYKTKRF